MQIDDDIKSFVHNIADSRNFLSCTDVAKLEGKVKMRRNTQ